MQRQGRPIHKLIRIVTLAPVLAAVSLTLLHLAPQPVYRGTGDYLLALVWLTVFPLLAYPLQPLIPKYRDRGREGQRKLAIVMAVLGYLGGTACSLITRACAGLRLVYLEYLLSGCLIFVFNKLLHVRASGHACGVAGPVAYLTWFWGPWALCGAAVLALVYWASLKMGRHTLRELAWGTALPVAALCGALALTGLL